MPQQRVNPLKRLERKKRSYSLIAVASVLVAALLIGAAASVRADAYLPAVLFAFSIALFVVLVLLHLAAERRHAATDDRKFIHWDAAVPELQRQNVNIEVRELARLLGVGDDQLGELLSAYIVGEDLAMRQIQQEENLPLLRHVSIGKTAFDAMLVDEDLITCIEMAFVVTPGVRQDKIDAIMRKMSQAKRNLAELKSRLRLRLMLVLVTQLTQDEEDELRESLSTRRFSDTPVDIDIRMLDFELLQKVYLTDQA